MSSPIPSLNMRYPFWLLIFCLVVASITLPLAPASAQNEVLLPFMEQLPQSTYQNPVARPSGRWSLGLPVISSVSGAYRNSAFSLKDIYFNRNDSSIISPSLMLGKMQNGGNTFFFGNSFDLAHVGWRQNNTWWMVSITDRLETELSLPGDLVRLAWQGNGPFIREGRAADFSSMRLNSTHFRELAMLMQFQVAEEQWLIGVRPKILFGLSNAHLAKADMSLFTDTANPFTLQARTDFELRYSTGTFDSKANNSRIQGADVAAYYLNFSNPGAGLDFGARYMPKGSPWNFSATVRDLGFITWNTNSRVLKSDKPQVDYRGVSLNTLVAENRVASVRTLTDSAREQLPFADNAGNYVTFLTAQANLMAQYNAADWIALGANANFWAFDGVKAAISANAVLKWRRWLGLGLSYTIQNGTYDNVGIGFYAKPGPIQYYIVTDQALGLAFPTQQRNFNVRTGINLVIGRDKRDRDKDGVEDKDDACPDVPGPVATKGCPDKDGDGVLDKDDNCPTVAGLKELMGCPDKDLDGITDAEDACPTEAGPSSTKGCPDKDKDGVADKDDKCPDVPGPITNMGCPLDTDKDGVPDSTDRCPTVAGLVELKGCPDQDKDGVADLDDDCPTVAGLASNMGCPPPPPVVVPPVATPPVVQDQDGDGIPDAEDKCPTLPGTAALKGCPPTDGDGVMDSDDLCPQTPGPVSNKGCPVLEKKQQEIIKRAFANLEFDYNKATIRAKSLPALKELAQLLASNEALRLRLSGHTDNAGNAKANMDLSKRRTLAVQQYVVKAGAKSNQVIAAWYGSTKPIASNATPQGRMKNRRVEMQVLYQ